MGAQSAAVVLAHARGIQIGCANKGRARVLVERHVSAAMVSLRRHALLFCMPINNHRGERSHSRASRSWRRKKRTVGAIRESIWFPRTRLTWAQNGRRCAKMEAFVARFPSLCRHFLTRSRVGDSATSWCTLAALPTARPSKCSLPFLGRAKARTPAGAGELGAPELVQRKQGGPCAKISWTAVLYVGGLTKSTAQCSDPWRAGLTDTYDNCETMCRRSTEESSSKLFQSHQLCSWQRSLVACPTRGDYKPEVYIRRIIGLP